MGGRFAYVSCADRPEVAVYRLTGATATPVAVTAIAGQSAPSASSPLAVSPDRRFLHAALREPPYPVTTFAIDPREGTLAWRGTAHLPASMAAIATDRSGRWLAGASYGDAVVAVTAIDADGVVRGAAPSIVAATAPKAHSILFAPDNRFIYSACLGGDVILRWRFDVETGLVEPERPVGTPVHSGAGPRHMRFGRSMMYVVNELDGTVVAFAHDARDGRLAHRQTVAAFAGSGGAAAADIHLTPDGRYLYASMRADSTIAAFAVDADDGTLMLIEHVEVETTPRGFAVTPDGTALLCAGRDAAALGVYAIAPGSGRLTRMEQHATSGNPNWVEIVDL